MFFLIYSQINIIFLKCWLWGAAVGLACLWQGLGWREGIRGVGCDLGHAVPM